MEYLRRKSGKIAEFLAWKSLCPASYEFLFEMGVIWDLHRIYIGLATKDLYPRKREKKNPIQSRIYKTIWEMGIQIANG